MPPFESLYNKPYKKSLSWDMLEERVIVGSELMEEQVKKIYNN